MSWNAQGIYSKIYDLYETLRVEEIDVALISETHLTDKMKLKDNGLYHIIRQDRVTHLGGLITFIRKGIMFEEVNCGPTGLLEYSAIKILNSNRQFKMINTYLPGGAPTSDIKRYLSNDLKTLLKPNDTCGCVLTGDLNAKHKMWNNLTNNAAGKILHNYTENNGYIVTFPRDHTYVPATSKKKPSTIDLLITNDIITTTRPYAKAIMTSDHIPFFFNVTAEQMTINRQKHPLLTQNINWQLFRKYMNASFGPELRRQRHDRIEDEVIDSDIDKFSTILKEALTKSTTTKRRTCGQYETKDIRKLTTSRNYYRQLYIRHHRREDGEMYNYFKQLTKAEIRKAASKEWDQKLAKCEVGDKKIYKIIRSRQRSPIPALYNDDRSSRLFEDNDKSNALATHFRKMHNNTLASDNLLLTQSINTGVRNYLTMSPTEKDDNKVTSSEIRLIIKGLKDGKAPGPDMIPVKAIKNLSYLGYDYLTEILNRCLDNNYFPKNWKIACTVGVPKPGKDPHDKASYRPIALLSVLSKIFEKIINKRLVQFIDNSDIIPDIQFGFRRQHSTTHALTHLHNHIKQGLDTKLTTGILSFDIEKAFDRVWQFGLIYKMIKWNFTDSLIRIVASFLTGRTFYVRINDAYSDQKDIPWGVPQGSVLSPTLYNIFISDLPRNLSDQTHIVLYADDTVLYTSDRKISLINTRLQKSAKTVGDYYKKWKIKINADKTALTCFTKRLTKQLPDEILDINQTEIKWTKEMKYLGMILDSRLTMRQHILHINQKIDKAIRLLYPLINRKSILSDRAKVHIYATYIRPIIMYATPLTLCMSKTNFKRLQVMQNNCLRLCLGISWEMKIRVPEIERRANIPNLTKFADNISTKFFKKCTSSTNPLIRQISQY